MNNEITGVQELLGALTDEPDAPGKRIMEREDEMFGMQRPSWGSPASLDSQDAASRLGIEMGEPTVKSAALRYAMLYDEQTSLEKLALMKQIFDVGRKALTYGGKALRGAQKGGTAASEGLKAVMKTTKPGAEIVEHGLGGASRRMFGARRVAAQAAKTEAKAGRLAAHQAATEGMTPGRRLLSNLGFTAKETGRGAAGKTLAGGGAAWTASDLAAGTRDLRNTGRYGYGR